MSKLNGIGASPDYSCADNACAGGSVVVGTHRVASCRVGRGLVPGLVPRRSRGDEGLQQPPSITLHRSCIVSASRMRQHRQAAQNGPDARQRPPAAREAYSLYVEPVTKGANEVDGPLGAACKDGDA